MGDIYLPLPADRKQMQEKKLAKLQQQIAEMEQRIQENVTLRQHLESISDAENERTQRVLDRLSSRNMLLKGEIERLYVHSKEPPASSSTTHLVNKVISQRTKEFSLLQQEKAMQIKYLMIEKQRLQEAQERLRLKRQMIMRQPTPVGKMTARYWGQKYDIYTPLSYNSYFDIYSPVFENGYYTYFPHELFSLRSKYPEENFWKRRERKRTGKNRRRVLYVPRPLHESSSW